MNNNDSKGLSILALVAAILSLSMGFAAFSSEIIIKGDVDIKPSSDLFDVNFSSSNTSEVDGEIVPTTSSTEVIANNAVIDNGDVATIKNIHAVFNKTGQSATYNFYVHNAGKYKAFLKAVVFANVNGKSSNKVCTSATGEDVSKVCDGVHITVKVLNNTYTGSQSNIFNENLNIDTYIPVEVVVSYDEDAALPQDPVKVTFGDISLQYNSID